MAFQIRGLASKLSTDVLDQTALEVHIEILEPITDRQHWLLLGKGQLQNSPIRLLSRFVGFIGGSCVLGFVFLRVNICRATGEHEGIQRRNQTISFALVSQWNERSLSSSLFNSLDVIFGPAALAGGSSVFLIGASPPRDANSRPM